MCPDVAHAGKGGVFLAIRVQPRAQKPGVQGVRNGALVVRLKSAPEKGRANEELVAVLAGFLDTARGDLEISSGAGSRNKRGLVRNRTLTQVTGKLAGLPDA